MPDNQQNPGSTDTVAVDDLYFRVAFHALPQPMALGEVDGRFVVANPVFKDVCGLDPVGRAVHELVQQPGSVDQADTAWPLVEEAVEAGTDGIVVEAVEGLGIPLRFRWRLNVCDNVLCLSGTDASSPEETSELRLSAKRLGAILGTTVDGVVTIDASGAIIGFNSAAQKIFGYSEEEMLGKNVSTLMPTPYREEHDDYIQNYLESGQGRIIGVGREVVGRRKDGTVFPMDLAVSDVTLGGRTTFTGIVRDITHRRELEQEILRIGDEERRRIGQDLHDELGQMLTGIGLMTQNVARRLAAREQPEAEDVQEITRFIREADEYARTLARGLVPVELDGHGLPAALMRLASNASTLFGINCSFHKAGPTDYIEPSSGMHLYRIAQEALSNAARHGNATHVRIELSQNAERIRLRVEDNGTGFSTDWESKGGSGVRIMKYRANIVGGSLDITESLSGGTAVGCTISLSHT